MKKLSLVILTGLVIAGSAFSTKAEAKTYNVAYDSPKKYNKAIKNATSEITNAFKSGQDKTISVKLKSKNSSLYNAREDVFGAAFEINEAFQKNNIRFNDGKKIKLYTGTFKLGKTKKLNTLVKITTKKAGKKTATLTYKITVKNAEVMDLSKREAEYKAKAMAEIKNLILEDSEAGKIVALFRFAQNKRNLSGKSYSDWEEFYKAPFKYAQDYESYWGSKCYTEALKAMGLDSKLRDYDGDAIASVKFQNKWYFVYPNTQALALGHGEGLACFYLCDGKMCVAKTDSDADPFGTIGNEVEEFYGSDEWRKANDDLDKKYKELYDEAFANTETESEYDALCEELDAKMQAEYHQIYKNKFPLLKENEDGTWTEDSIALYDYREVSNEKGTAWVKIFVNQHDVTFFE